MPRARQAPDGGKEGGSQPTDTSRINRRLLLAPPLPMYGGQKHHDDLKKSCSQLLTLEVIATLAVSYGQNASVLAVSSTGLLGTIGTNAAASGSTPWHASLPRPLGAASPPQAQSRSSKARESSLPLLVESARYQKAGSGLALAQGGQAATTACEGIPLQVLQLWSDK